MARVFDAEEARCSLMMRSCCGLTRSLLRGLSAAAARSACVIALMSCATAQEGIPMRFNPADVASDGGRLSNRPQAVSPRPRDGDIAIREEFAAAVVKGEIAALRLFIRRHPEHELAAIAEIMIVRGVFEPPSREQK